MLRALVRSHLFVRAGRGSPRRSFAVSVEKRVTLSKSASTILDAIRQASAVASSLPESEVARRLCDECQAYERTAEQWERAPPSVEEREVLMKKILALHIVVTRVRRSSFPPPSRSE